MIKERRLLIVKGMTQQYEDSLESLTFELRICTKAKDERGADAAKKRAIEMETKLAELKEIEKEIEQENVGNN